MGYRSDVALVLTFDGVQFFHSRLKDDDIYISVQNFLNRADEHYVDTATGAEVWYWEWIKWYAGDICAYTEPTVIEEILGLLDEKDFRFIRLGEEDDDVQNRGMFFDNPFNVDIVRYINVEEPPGSTRNS